MLNQQIGQYQIISKLGEGGMAIVYLAEKGTLGKKVALKVLKEEFLLNRHIRGRFLSEARKMINLNHPNIVGVHDLIDDADFVAIELDYIEGKTLKQHLQEKGSLADNEIEHLFKQMIDAIGYVHEKGFIHRDIKPSNFMLTESGIIKLTDFGIAKNVDDSNMDYTGTGTGIQMGTPKYMSPEQVRSTKDVDHRTDIYSLGVVLWEMVTGKVPYFTGTGSTFELFEKIVREKFPLTNSRWDEIIQKATEKEVDERYSYISLLNIKTIKDTNEPILANSDTKSANYQHYIHKALEWAKIFTILEILLSAGGILLYFSIVDNYYYTVANGEPKGLVLNLIPFLFFICLGVSFLILLFTISRSINNKSFKTEKFIRNAYRFWKFFVFVILITIIITIIIGVSIS